jgi:protease-4
MKKKTIGIFALLLGILAASLSFALLLSQGDLPSPMEIVVVKLTGEIGGAGGALSQDAFIDAARTRETLDSLAEDPLVAGVVLEINSPGGSSAPTAEIVYSIEDLRKTKPVVSYVSDTGASGGYWIASSADKVVVAPLAVVGSIGVFSDFVDASSLLSKIGVNYTLIKSGKYKDAGVFSRPLTDEERAYFQDLNDKVYDEFVSSVAEARGLSRETLLPLAQGQVFLGREAVTLGLADRVGTRKDAISLAESLAGGGTYTITELSGSGGWVELLQQIGSSAGRALGTGFSEALVYSFAKPAGRV